MHGPQTLLRKIVVDGSFDGEQRLERQGRLDGGVTGEQGRQSKEMGKQMGGCRGWSTFARAP